MESDDKVDDTAPSTANVAPLQATLVSTPVISQDRHGLIESPSVSDQNPATHTDHDKQTQPLAEPSMIRDATTTQSDHPLFSRTSSTSSTSSHHTNDEDQIDHEKLTTRPPLATLPTTAQSTRSLPRLKRKETRLMQKHSHPLEHLGITLGFPMILLFDVVIPLIIYYTWYNSHKSTWRRQCTSLYPNTPLSTCPIARPEFDKDILGSAVACFGFGELWILLARVYRLFVRSEHCAPLLSRSRWELDATSWVYLTAMIVALLPFVIGASLVNTRLYLYGPSFLMGFLGILMFITTFLPFTLPIGINSQPRHTKLRPFIYYAAEDFLAVDGLQDREFRVRYNERYESNGRFRRMFRDLTLWWLFGVLVFIGSVSAVIWTCEFHIAFGTSLGVLFGFIGIWAGTTYAYVRWEINRQHRSFEEEQEKV